MWPLEPGIMAAAVEQAATTANDDEMVAVTATYLGCVVRNGSQSGSCHARHASRVMCTAKAAKPMGTASTTTTKTQESHEPC